jgi:hypothetical protein
VLCAAPLLRAGKIGAQDLGEPRGQCPELRAKSLRLAVISESPQMPTQARSHPSPAVDKLAINIECRAQPLQAVLEKRVPARLKMPCGLLPYLRQRSYGAALYPTADLALQAQSMLAQSFALCPIGASLHKVTTLTFDIMKSDPTLGRAEALRRTMLAYLNDLSDPRNAYPAYWAPFVVVGQGAARKQCSAIAALR